MDNMKIDDLTFKKEVLEADKPTIVDFWAEWCGPCHMVSPVLEEIAEEHKEKVKLVKINVDENPVLSSQYNITSIPTLLLFHKGKIAKEIIGAAPKKAILSEFGEYLH